MNNDPQPMIDKLINEIKRHERKAKRCTTLETKLHEQRMASYKRGLIHRLRLAVFDLQDGKTTIGEVLSHE